MTAPPLTERQRPGLSETLTGPKAPGLCQNCGAQERVQESYSGPFTRWRECDEWDRHDGRSPIVILCAPCSERLIERHPRLYVPLELHEPAPGVMQICGDCPMREGTRCNSPLAKVNGGPGMAIKVAQPQRVHVRCGKPGRSGWRLWWSEPTGCAGKDAAA